MAPVRASKDPNAYFARPWTGCGDALRTSGSRPRLDSACLPPSSSKGAGGILRYPARETFCIVFLLTAPVAVASPVSASTTVHTYSYNVDGALTAITTQTNDQPPTTTYLTWDDFTPDAATPTTGTVTAGDGRLLGYGPTPGTDALTARFTFDPRDRLLSYSGAAGTETYDYHADGMMMSSSAGGDELRFYSDAFANPQVTNIHQTGADLWSAWLDRNRFLDDGNERILLQPRKDMACTYDAANRALESYAYDAFGASPGQGAASGPYDLRDNPFRYAGEYRDPIWGGYFLRARWYDPDLPVFLSRDPEQHLNRYAYGNGNPVMNLDPSGMNIFKEANKWVNQGIGGHFARIFLAPLLGPLQILADPKGFWEQIKTDKDGIDIFLAAGVATEGLSIGLEGFGLSAFVRNLGLAKRFGTRLAVDIGLGVGQAVAGGADRGFKHFNWESFAQNVELGAGGLVYGKLGAGIGYNAFTLKGEDILKRVQNLPDDSVLVFRERTEGNSLKTFTSPLLESAKIGRYHERIIVVSKDFSVASDLLVRKHGGEVFGAVRTSSKLNEARAVTGFFSDKSRAARYQFVGSLKGFSKESFLSLNPRGLLAGSAYQDLLISGDWGRAPRTARYGRWTNNCHYHAQAVLGELGF
jgi:RHS repeat-associated protein